MQATKFTDLSEATLRLEVVPEGVRCPVVRVTRRHARNLEQGTDHVFVLVSKGVLRGDNETFVANQLLELPNEARPLEWLAGELLEQAVLSGEAERGDVVARIASRLGVLVEFPPSDEEEPGGGEEVR